MTPIERWHAVMDIRGINGPDKAVLGCLAYHAGNSMPVEAWPALQTIADETGFSVTAVRNAIRSLARNGLLEFVEQSTGRHSNRYRLNLTQPLATRRVKGLNHTPREGLNPSRDARQPLARRASTPRQETTNKERTRNEQSNEQNKTPTASSIWDVWIGIAGEKHRGTLGKLIGIHGEVEVAKAVAVVSSKRPADPVAFIRGVLKKNTRGADRTMGSPI